MQLLKKNVVVTLCTAVFLLTGCGPEQVSLDGKTMGTYYAVKYVADSGKPSPERIKAEIDRRLELVNDQMSTYRVNSELSRFNQSTEINKPFPVSAAMAKVVRESIRISHLTKGALDVTVGPLVNLWGFGPEGRPDRIPNDDEINKRRAWIGIDHLQVQDNALVKAIPQLYVDLSSIAKGYGVDVIAEYLADQKINNYMVDIGGEVRTHGVNGNQIPWRIAIEKPQTGTEQLAQEVIQPGNMAIATSGDYRNYFEENGQRFSHEIDPETGRPVTHNLASITVLAPSCMTADGLSTGLDIMGPKRALMLANQENIPVFMIIKTQNGFEERYSQAFKPYLNKVK